MVDSVDPCRRDYTITLEKNGVPLRTGQAKVEVIRWERIFDQFSQAQVIFHADKSCCGDLPLVDHWNTDLVIQSGGVVKWRGPVQRVTYRRGVVVVDAADTLAWMVARMIRSEFRFTDTDVSELFEVLWNHAVASVDSPHHELVVFPSNTTATRRIKPSENRLLWNVIRDMLDAGLDLTTVGSKVIVGPISGSPLVLTSDSVQGDIEVVKDGDLFGNRIVVDAADNVNGAFPTSGLVGQFGYPLVERSISDASVQTAASAQDIAESQFNFAARGIRRVRANNGLVLVPDPNLDPSQLVAGMMVTFTPSDELCYTATETFRLNRIGFESQSGRETVSIDLQPLGSGGIFTGGSLT